MSTSSWGRPSEWIAWVVGTLIAVGMAYGSLNSGQTFLQTQITELREERDKHDADLHRQLQRIEGQLQSIEEFLRAKDAK